MWKTMWLYGILILVTGLCLSLTTAFSATVGFRDLPSSLSVKCGFPRELRVDIKTGVQFISLTLTRSNTIIPTYAMRTNEDGSVNFVEKRLSSKNKVALYQADTHKAEFQVSCHQDEQSKPFLVLNGTLERPDGKMYSLENSESPNQYILTEEHEAIDPSEFETTGYNDEVENPAGRFIRSAEERVKREITNNIYIDAVALVEYSVYERWYARSAETSDELKQAATFDGISQHFAHLFNAVDIRFKTASPLLNINLVGLIIEDNTSGEWFESVRRQESNKSLIDANKLLDSSYDLSKTAGFPEHDHLVSFTSENLYAIINGNVSSSVAGLAYVGQICKENGKSVSTLEYKDNFPTDVRRTSHEMAHCLSARHDGSFGNACSKDDNYIMNGSPKTFKSTNPFTFSSCSSAYFDDYINGLLDSGSTSSRDCLLKPLQAVTVPDVGSALPGQIYDINEQCAMANGIGSTHCSSINISDSTICLKMWCRVPGTSGCNLRYAARGSPCGNNKWCEGGECVDVPTNNCGDKVCQNGGSLDQDTCDCHCLREFKGSLCEEPLCGPPCQNGGTMDFVTCTCTCPDTWYGNLCEETTTTAPTTTATQTTTSAVTPITTTTITASTTSTSASTATFITPSTSTVASSTTRATSTPISKNTPTTATSSTSTSTTTISTTGTTSTTTTASTPGDSTTSASPTPSTTTVVSTTTTSTPTSTTTPATTRSSTSSSTTTISNTDTTSTTVTATTTTTTTSTPGYSTTSASTTHSTSTTTLTSTSAQTPTTAQSSCSVAPDLANAEVTLSDNTATYKCKEHFATKEGSNSVSTCLNDVWSEIDLQCIDVSNCSIKNGRTLVYTGTMSTTSGGKYTCQPWDAQKPNKHSVRNFNLKITTADSTPTLAESGNYCRDPFGAGRLWCVTTDPYKKWDYCDPVPTCNTTIPSCPEPPVVANAQVTIADTKATYKCKEGFATLSEVSSVSTCTKGVWSAVGLQCIDVSNCSIKNGRTLVYTGTMSTTSGGKYTCQPWDAQTPNKHSVRDFNLKITTADSTPTLAESGNYCRDPFGAGRLWCVTTDPYKKWDYCDPVPTCDTTLSFV